HLGDVMRAEHEDVAGLDAAEAPQHPAALGAAVTVDDAAQVRHLAVIVAPEHDVPQVLALDVGAGDRVGHTARVGVDDDLAGEPGGPDRARADTGELPDDVGFGELDLGHPERARELVLVELVVPADDGEHRALAAPVDQALEQLGARYSEERRDLLDAALVRRGDGL